MLAGAEEALHRRKPLQVNERRSAIESLLASLIDYAGLYPPAGLDMRLAVHNYLSYREGKHASALGRFIVDVSRIDELRAVAGSLQSIPLSVIATPDESARLQAFLNAGLPIEAIEIKTGSRTEVLQPTKLPLHIKRFIELPVGDSEALAAISAVGADVKLRMGGIVPDAFPPVEAVARMLAVLAEHRLAFKATAGLHHPVRSRHPFTYAKESDQGIMHGFVNLVCAAALIHFGGQRRGCDRAS